MGVSIGLVELVSIPHGYQLSDVMLHAAPIELLRAQPACPGKFLIMFTGDVAAVRTALQSVNTSGIKVSFTYSIENVHPDVVLALKTTQRDVEFKAFGCLETRYALAALEAADVIAKAANVCLLRVRLAQGIGGKGYITFTGAIAAVNNALEACQIHFADRKQVILSSCAIASPHQELVSSLKKGI